MNECNVCYDKVAKVKCFGSCSIELCIDCFNTMLKINMCKDIEFCCPQCRLTSIKNKDRKFTVFLEKNKSSLKKIISLYEPILETNVSSQTSHRWHDWNARITREAFQRRMFDVSRVDWDRLNSDQLAEITYYDYDEDIPDVSNVYTSYVDIYGTGI
jgi:hypothetical protein